MLLELMWLDLRYDPLFDLNFMISKTKFKKKVIFSKLFIKTLKISNQKQNNKRRNPLQIVKKKLFLTNTIKGQKWGGGGSQWGQTKWI